MPRLSKDQWAMLARDYAADVSVAQLARKYGIARQTIMERAKKQCWTVRPKEEIYDATQAKLHGLTPDSSPEAKAALTEKVADDRAQLISRHQKEWKEVARLRGDAYAVLQGKAPTVITIDYETATAMETKERIALAGKLIAMYEADARALNALQEGQRRAHGFDYKSQQQTDTKDENVERERKRLADSLISMVAKVKAMSREADHAASR